MANAQQSTNLTAAMSNLAPSDAHPDPAGLENSGVVRGSSENMNRGLPEGSPFSGVRDAQGYPVIASEITPDSLVTLPGLGTMQLRSALSAGFITQGADGKYAAGDGVAPSAAQEPSPTQDQDHPDLSVEPMDAESEAALAELVGNTTPGTQIAAVHEIADGGEITEETLVTLATELGVENPVAAAEAIAPVQEAFEAQATATVEAAGIPDAYEFWAWAYAERGPAMKSAIIDQGTKGTTHAYKALAQEYVQGLDKIAPDALLDAQLGDGVKVHKGTRGEIIITAKGRDMSWREALSSGAVSLSRAE